MPRGSRSILGRSRGNRRWKPPPRGGDQCSQQKPQLLVQRGVDFGRVEPGPAHSNRTSASVCLRACTNFDRLLTSGSAGKPLRSTTRWQPRHPAPASNDENADTECDRRCRHPGQGRARGRGLRQSPRRQPRPGFLDKGQPAVSATQIFDAIDADGVTLLVSDGWMVEPRQAIFGRSGRGGFVASVEMRTRQRTSPRSRPPGRRSPFHRRPCRAG